MKEVIPLSIKHKIRLASDGTRIYNFGVGVVKLPAYTIYYYHRGRVYWGTALCGKDYTDYIKSIKPKQTGKFAVKRAPRGSGRVHPLVAALQNVDMIFDEDERRAISIKNRRDSLGVDVWCTIIDKWRNGARIRELELEYGVCSTQIYYYAERINNIIAARNAVGSAI